MKFYGTIALALFVVGCDGSNSVPKLFNAAPTISGSIESIRVGEQLNFIPQSSDADGDTLEFSI